LTTSQSRNLSQLKSTLTERADADKESLTSQLIALHEQIDQLKEQVKVLANPKA
jgi:hypothetical protein